MPRNVPCAAQPLPTCEGCRNLVNWAGKQCSRAGIAKIEEMATVTSGTAPAAAPPRRSPFFTVLLAWLIPGGGHFLLGRWGRGAILAAAIVITFLIGLGMQGPMFKLGQDGGDVLTRVIGAGGFIGDVATGVLYFVTEAAGYTGSDSAGHSPEYASKLLVTAGLLNILAMVDAYEIAERQKV